MTASTPLTGLILDAAKACVASMNITVDAGAPAQFEHEGLLPLEQATGDRSFEVRFIDGGDRQFQGVPGLTDAWMRFYVRVKYVNEGRSTTDFDVILSQDMRRIADFVPQAVRDVDGVGECVLDQGWSVSPTNEPTVMFGRCDFRVEYVDTLVTA